MGIVKKLKKENERLKAQIEMMKRSIAGRGAEALKESTKAKMAEIIIENIVKSNGGTLEVPGSLSGEGDIVATYDTCKKAWILKVK